MVNRHFILHLSVINGVGPAAINAIVDYIRSGASASDLYFFSAQDFTRYCGITEKVAALLVAGLSDITLLDRELSLIEKHKIKWAVIEDDCYPTLLRTIYMPPAVLYWQGGDFNDLLPVKNELKKHCAVVGSRALNKYGEQSAHEFVEGLVQAGIVIVSGGALGIDTIAHDTTLKTGGKTIVVLGSGLLEPYPMANKTMFKRVIETGGLVVSSFPLLARPLPTNFPARNRIIAGLSHGCLVVQAAEKSGSLITAHYALEQGREVFAIPGHIDDPLSFGCHSLIRSGATLVTNPSDILQEYGLARSKSRDVQITLHDAQKLVKKENEQSVLESAYQRCSDAQKTIFNACRKPASLDDIVQATGLDMAVIQAELFDMQLDGKLQQNFIGMWVVVR